jgi:hypothetical protein
LLLAGVVAIAALQLVGRGDGRGAVDPEDLDSIRAAVPELLGGACLLGSIPLEAGMDDATRDELVDDRLASLHDDLLAVYTAEPAAQLEPGLRALLDGMHSGGDAISRLDCTFEASEFLAITVRSGDAEVHVAGVFHQVAGAPVSTELAYAERTFSVSLARVGAGWKLVEFHEDQPPEAAS